jgi:hypothetical protein
MRNLSHSQMSDQASRQTMWYAQVQAPELEKDAFLII